ncbi:hypothetical protein [Paenibacillus sp. Root52]|uniref:hypothetical protein n=1 Tax=Paenibacillus sp. Root52 TaxID=1736552 RepID=UPI0012E3A85D|nr:hypothetical protein [Paenibacillus sp. Root52]
MKKKIHAAWHGRGSRTPSTRLDPTGQHSLAYIELILWTPCYAPVVQQFITFVLITQTACT